jgi:7,8-dihydropterin-6-yl-methyl-4-(beta-D-ribofuranosyl)aminobenzene 5'-phosphate synthase
MIKITVLTDNTVGSGLLAEHGFSCFIEDAYSGTRWLFDTGASGLFKENASKLGIDVNQVDGVILSHGHFDHGGGLSHVKGHRLICHPECFTGHFRGKDHSYIGLPMTGSQTKELFRLETAREPLQLTDRMWFLGQIPRVTDFESQTTPFVLADGTPDFVTDDSALAIVVEDGLFVLTGCGHSGVVNTLEYAKKVTGINRIKGVMGGFHLKAANKQTQLTIEYLQREKVDIVLPSHCTALPALSSFWQAFKFEQVKTGTQVLVG